MSFTQFPIEQANKLINHGPTVLVTSSHANETNIMTAAWCMPVSHSIPMVAVSIAPQRRTHDIILDSREFAISVPHHGLIKELWCCGTNTGKEQDKFAQCGLTPLGAKYTNAPLVKECLGALECRLVSHPTVGDHTLMVGEVLAAWVKQDAMTDRLKVEEYQTLHHLGGEEFCLSGLVVKI